MEIITKQQGGFGLQFNKNKEESYLTLKEVTVVKEEIKHKI